MVKYDFDCSDPNDLDSDLQFAMEYQENYYPCKILGFFDMYKEHGQRIYMLLHTTDGLFHDQVNDQAVVTGLTESWKLSYTWCRKEKNPTDVYGEALQGPDGKPIQQMHIYTPQMSLLDVETIGERIYVVEEDSGIHEEKVIVIGGWQQYQRSIGQIGQVVSIE